MRQARSAFARLRDFSAPPVAKQHGHDAAAHCHQCKHNSDDIDVAI